MKLKASDFKSPDLELYDEDDGTYFLAIGDPYAGDEHENRLANVDIAMLKNKGYAFEAIYIDQKLLCFRIQETIILDKGAHTNLMKDINMHNGGGSEKK